MSSRVPPPLEETKADVGQLDSLVEVQPLPMARPAAGDEMIVLLGITTGFFATLVARRGATLSQQLMFILVGAVFVIELWRLILGGGE